MSFAYDHTQFASRLGEHDAAGRFERFYVPRIEMPQIDDDQKLIEVLCSQFGSAPIHRVDIRNLRFHQHVFMDRSLEKTIPEAAMAKPIVISADGYVVDGNHRARAHLDRGVYEVNAIRVPLVFTDALRWLATQPFVTHSAPRTRGE